MLESQRRAAQSGVGVILDVLRRSRNIVLHHRVNNYSRLLQRIDYWWFGEFHTSTLSRSLSYLQDILHVFASWLSAVSSAKSTILYPVFKSLLHSRCAINTVWLTVSTCISYWKPSQVISRYIHIEFGCLWIDLWACVKDDTRWFGQPYSDGGICCVRCRSNGTILSLGELSVLLIHSNWSSRRNIDLMDEWGCRRVIGVQLSRTFIIKYVIMF